MKVALFFGSFNPIHVGHLMLANHVVNETDVKELWFVVSPQNPFKEKSTLLADHHRLYMCRLATENNPNFKVSDIEFHLEQPSYTAVTLAHLTEKYPNHEFVLVMGEDNLHGLHKWYNVEYLLKNYEIIVYERPASEKKPIQDAEVWNLPYKKIDVLKNTPQLLVSSSFIRNQIKAKKSVQYLLTPEIEKHIEEMHFYQ